MDKHIKGKHPIEHSALKKLEAAQKEHTHQQDLQYQQQYQQQYLQQHQDQQDQDAPLDLRIESKKAKD